MSAYASTVNLEIVSTRSSRIAWIVLGALLAGGFLVGGIFVSMQTGLSPALIAVVFPIGLGVITILWLGRPAWIKVSETEVSFVPPLGAAKVFPKDSIKRIVRVFGSRSATLQFRNAGNHTVLKIEQEFARDDVEKVAAALEAKLIWDTRGVELVPADPSEWKAAAEAAGMDADQIAEIAKHVK